MDPKTKYVIADPSIGIVSYSNAVDSGDTVDSLPSIRNTRNSINSPSGLGISKYPNKLTDQRICSGITTGSRSRIQI